MSPALRNLLVLVGVVVAGGGAVTYSVYAPERGVTAARLADAGVAAANRAATCPVELDPECVQWLRDVGLAVRRYESVEFPVALLTEADGGRPIILPEHTPRLAARACIELRDLDACVLRTCAARPGMCPRWDDAQPFRLAARTGRCARKHVDAGFAGCTLLDGGDPGDMNVYPSSRLAGTCEVVEARWPYCSVVAGEVPEEVL